MPRTRETDIINIDVITGSSFLALTLNKSKHWCYLFVAILRGLIAMRLKDCWGLLGIHLMVSQQAYVRNC